MSMNISHDVRPGGISLETCLLFTDIVSYSLPYFDQYHSTFNIQCNTLMLFSNFSIMGPVQVERTGMVNYLLVGITLLTSTDLYFYFLSLVFRY